MTRRHLLLPLRWLTGVLSDAAFSVAGWLLRWHYRLERWMYPRSGPISATQAQWDALFAEAYAEPFVRMLDAKNPLRDALQKPMTIAVEEPYGLAGVRYPERTITIRRPAVLEP